MVSPAGIRRRSARPGDDRAALHGGAGALLAVPARRRPLAEWLVPPGGRGERAQARDITETFVLRRSTAASPPTPRAMRAATHAAPRLRSEGANAAVGAADCWEPAAGAADAPRAEGAAAGVVPCGCKRSAVWQRGACPAAGGGDRGRLAAAAGLERGRRSSPWEATASLAACHSQISLP